MKEDSERDKAAEKALLAYLLRVKEENVGLNRRLLLMTRQKLEYKKAVQSRDTLIVIVGFLSPIVFWLGILIGRS